MANSSLRQKQLSKSKHLQSATAIEKNKTNFYRGRSNQRQMAVLVPDAKTIRSDFNKLNILLKSKRLSLKEQPVEI